MAFIDGYGFHLDSGTTTDGYTAVTIFTGTANFTDTVAVRQIMFKIVGVDEVSQNVVSSVLQVTLKQTKIFSAGPPQQYSISVVGTPVEIVSILQGSDTDLRACQVSVTTNAQNYFITAVGIADTTIHWAVNEYYIEGEI